MCACYCSPRYLIFNEGREKWREMAIWAPSGCLLCASLRSARESCKWMFSLSCVRACAFKCVLVTLCVHVIISYSHGGLGS